MMTSEMRKSPIQSINEMFDRNFTVVVVDSESEFIPVQPILESRER